MAGESGRASARPLRVCIISEDFPGERGCGGIGTYTHVLARGLASLGHRVHVVTRTWGDANVEEADGVRVHRVPVPEPSWRRGTRVATARFWETLHILRWNLAVRGVVKRIASADGLDVIESPEYRAQGLLTAIAHRRFPLVVRLHGSSYYARSIGGIGLGWSRADTVLAERLECELGRRARLVVAASRPLAEQVKRAWRLGAGKIRLVPLPMDTDVFLPRTGTVLDDGTILYVGRISLLKGVDTLIEALPAIREACPGARLRLVGKEDPWPGGGRSTADELRRRLGDAGVPESVVEFRKPVARSALPDVYQAAAVCVIPSPAGSSGYTCLEAMASGCAVVATGFGPGHVYLTHERDGLLVPPRSPQALASAVVRLLANPGLRRQLADVGRKAVRERFGSAVIGAETALAYRSLLA